MKTNIYLSAMAAMALTAPLHAAGTLVAHYTFDSLAAGAGGVTDSAGSNNGTANGDTATTPGLFGNAYTFDGTGDYVNFGTSATLKRTGSFTATMWLQVSTSPAENLFLFGSANGIGNGNTGWVVKSQTIGAMGTRLFFDTNNGGAQRNNVIESSSQGTISTAANTWQFVAVRYDSTIGNISFTNLGLDSGSTALTAPGVAAQTIENGAPANGELALYPGNPMTIGALNGGGSAFAGKFDDIRFYDDALSNTELSVLYNAGVAAIPEPSSSALLGLGGLALIMRRRR